MLCLSSFLFRVLVGQVLVLVGPVLVLVLAGLVLVLVLVGPVLVNITACLYFISVHQMAPPVNVVENI